MDKKAITGMSMEYIGADGDSFSNHTYHHYDRTPPSITVKAERNSKGWNYEAAVSGCESVEQAMELLKRATQALENQYGGKE